MVQYQKINDSWKSDKPVLIYGMGSATIDYIDILTRRGNKICGITDSCALKNVHGDAKYSGYMVWGKEQLLKNADNINIVIVAFRISTIKSIYESLEHVGNEKTFRVFGYGNIESYWGWTDSAEKTRNQLDEEKINFVYNHLKDEKSKKVLMGIKNYKLSLQVTNIINIMTQEPPYFINHPAFALRDDEVFIDAGTFIGDTIIEFYKKTRGKYKAIYGFEPNTILNETARTMVDLHKIKNTVVYNKGLYDEAMQLIYYAPDKNRQAGRIFEQTDALKGLETESVEVVSLDELLLDKESKITFIKMDIEGAELRALDGCRKIIQRDKPRLAICAYHSLTDFYEIPYKIMCEYKDYNVLLRHHSETVAETICYAYID